MPRNPSRKGKSPARAKTTVHTIPKYVYTTLDLLGKPGAHLFLIGQQTYIASTKILFCHPLPMQTFDWFCKLEWIGPVEQKEYGFIYPLTEAGRKILDQRQVNRVNAARFVQQELTGLEVLRSVVS